MITKARVISEKQDLQIKYDALLNFMSNSKNVEHLPLRAVSYLAAQLRVMREYLNILKLRLEEWDELT